MLNEQEIGRIQSLLDGSVQPETGFEKHFLRVIRGESIACSPRENEWLRFAIASQQDSADRPSPQWRQGEIIERLHYEIEQRQSAISSLRQELESQRGLNVQNADLISRLNAKISQLEGFLAECHKTIAKYEKLPPPLITDVEAKNALLRKHANAVMTKLLTKDIYSSIDGQD